MYKPSEVRHGHALCESVSEIRDFYGEMTKHIHMKIQKKIVYEQLTEQKHVCLR